MLFYNAGTPPGTTLFSNLRLAYQLRNTDPFFAVDHQQTSPTADRATGIRLPFSRSRETALGAGVVVYFGPTLFAHVSYSRSVEGKNTLIGDGLQLGLASIFGVRPPRRFSRPD